MAKECQQILKQSSSSTETRNKNAHMSQHTQIVSLKTCRYLAVSESAMEIKKSKAPEYMRLWTHGPWEYCSMTLASDRHPCAAHLLLSQESLSTPCLTPFSDDLWNKTWTFAEIK